MKTLKKIIKALKMPQIEYDGTKEIDPEKFEKVLFYKVFLKENCSECGSKYQGKNEEYCSYCDVERPFEKKSIFD